jgi:hypothetical protein
LDSLDVLDLICQVQFVNFLWGAQFYVWIFAEVAWRKWEIVW